MSEAALRIGAPGAQVSHLRATIALAWPLIVTNLAQTAMNTTDVVMMGWLGPDALAAGALASNLYFTLLMFGVGLATATAAMTARELGRNRHSVREVRHTVRQGLWTAGMLCGPIFLLLWWSESILLALRQIPELAAAAGAYMRTLQWSMLPFLGFIVLRSFMAALERPHWPLVVGLAAIALNALANWGLMFGNFGLPRLELVGAGIATTLSSSVMFATLSAILVTHRKYRRYRLFGRFWRADWPRLRELWRIGLPIGVTLLLEVAVFSAAVYLMGLIGAPELAAHTIALQIAAVTFMVPLGLGQAATVRVGRAYGAGDPGAVARAGWTALALGVGFMAAMALVMILAPRPLIALFLDLADPESAAVAEIAVGFLFFAALFQIFDGAQAVGLGMLRGLHDTRIPMIFAALGYWAIGLPLGAWLGFELGLAGEGIWMGLAIGIAVVAALLVGRWTMRERLGLVERRG